MATKRCYYEVLAVTRDADDGTIKAAYRQLALQYSPDRNPDDALAEAKFKEASEAYEVLRDPDKRQIYDRYGHAGLESRGQTPHFDDINSIFNMFGGLFDMLGGGGGGGRRGRRGPRPGRDIQYNLSISLLEAYQGGEKTITLPRQHRCETCAGSGRKPGSSPAKCRRCDGRGVVVQGQSFFRLQTTCIACAGSGEEIKDPCSSCNGQGAIECEETLTFSIPPGVDSGHALPLQGQGEAGEPGGPAGDLYIVFQVEPDERFVRRDLDLHCDVSVGFGLAALGGTIEVPLLTGEAQVKELPRGTQGGDELRFRGLGMPSLRSKKRGDIVVHIRIVTPTNLTKRQEELLRELGQLESPP